MDKFKIKIAEKNCKEMAESEIMERQISEICV